MFNFGLRSLIHFYFVRPVRLGGPEACEAAAGYYEKYARLCVKDTALVDGRVAYERGNVRRRSGIQVLDGIGSAAVDVELLMLLVAVSLLLLVLLMIWVLLLWRCCLV